MSYDKEIMDYIACNPGSGLHEISAHMYLLHKADFDRTADPVKNVRTKTDGRLKSLHVRGMIYRQKDDKGFARYWVK